jgi:hypothetical protein
MPDYDFDFLEKSGPLQELPNFHITRCCGNCFYFTYAKNRQRRSYCRLFEVLARSKGLNKRAGEHYHVDAVKGNWRKVHTTTVCDAHRIRSYSHVFEPISEWCGLKFNGLGEVDAL